MNYLKTYCSLIRKAENRDCPEGYVEKHHIFPKSIFGNNNRVVVLTAREHYIAHALLEKVYMSRYGIDDNRTKKMTYAFWIMSTKNKNNKVNSHIFENLRLRRITILREKMINDNHFKGKTHTEKTKEKMRGRKICENVKMRLSEINCRINCKLTSPTGDIFFTDNLPQFCKKTNLTYCCMHRVVAGKRKTHKGWTGLLINRKND